jgi:membrane protease YdiL (CAAX protease family)
VTDAVAVRGAGWRAVVREHRLIAFGALVIVFTLAIAAANLGRDTAPFALIFVPAIAALLISGVADGRRAVGLLFRRLGRWRVAPRWYAAALGLPLLTWVGVGIGGFLVGDPPDEAIASVGQLPIVFLVVLLPAFIEEFGWRGFGVPAAPRSWPLLVTAFVVGALFIIPHLALYLPGGLYDNLPLWPLVLIILSGSVLFTWAFVGSGGSVPIAALMHAASNGLTPLSRGIDPVMEWQLHGIVITILAIVVVLLSRRFRERTVDGTEGDSTMPSYSSTANATA